ncbi:MAG TPA: universal stress protein [Candidatus Hypogeohydataceae bacterium YC41]
MYKKILIAYDGSEPSKTALKAAIELAKLAGAELHSLSVEEHLPHYASTVTEVLESKRERNSLFKELIEEAKQLALEQGVTLNANVLPGHAVETIIHYAERGNFDLIVVGRATHSRIFKKLLGRTANQIILHAPCSVLVVK